MVVWPFIPLEIQICVCVYSSFLKDKSYILALLDFSLYSVIGMFVLSQNFRIVHVTWNRQKAFMWQQIVLHRGKWEASFELEIYSLALAVAFFLTVFVYAYVQVGVSWQPCTVWCSLTSLAWTSSDLLCWRCWRGDGRTAVWRWPIFCMRKSRPNLGLCSVFLDVLLENLKKQFQYL